MVLVTVKEYNSGVGAFVFMENSHNKGGATFMRACTEALKRSTQNDAVFSVYENKKNMISYQNGKMK